MVERPRITIAIPTSSSVRSFGEGQCVGYNIQDKTQSLYWVGSRGANVEELYVSYIPLRGMSCSENGEHQHLSRIIPIIIGHWHSQYARRPQASSLPGWDTLEHISNGLTRSISIQVSLSLSLFLFRKTKKKTKAKVWSSHVEMSFGR